MTDESKLKECFEGDNFIVFLVLLILLGGKNERTNDDE